MSSENKGKILITSTEDNFNLVKGKISGFGFTPVSFPVIEIKPMEYTINRRDCNWIIFTSKNSVKCLKETEDKEFFSGKKAACIGGQTKEELEKRGIKVDFVPAKFDSDSFIEEFTEINKTRKIKFLIPSSKIAGKVIEKGLKSHGGVIEKVIVYDTAEKKKTKKEMEEFIKNKPYEFIVFSSPSCFRNFISIAGKGELNGVKTAAMGKKTAAVMGKEGIKPDIVPKTQTFSGIIDSINEFLKEA